MNRNSRRSIGRLAISLAGMALLAAAVTNVPTAGAQSRQTQQVMRQKLAETQQLLTALVTSNWTALDRRAKAIQALTNQPGWDVMREPEFHTQTVAFQKAVQGLIDSAGKRDQRTALEAYNGLVSGCVECHRYVARARVAGAK